MNNRSQTILKMLKGTYIHCCRICTNTHICIDVNILIINEITWQRAKVNKSTPKKDENNFLCIQKYGKREKRKVKADGTETNS